MQQITIFHGLENMLTIVVVAMLVVLVAMSIDLASGVYKAKLRGEVRSSEALKRTLSKFIAYEGGMMIAAGVDLLFHLSNVVALFHLDAIYGVPVITCLVGVFLLVVEFISIREKADKKIKREMKDAAELISQILANDTLKEALKTAMEAQEKDE